ncbi:MAG: hypothetical protein NVV73_20865 [Cellvibrionaceae bacterium]|nr:hypothetical protein [Cellvibrionaceae bacterium]
MNRTAAISKNVRIARNTLMLYFRQLLILFVSLYTIRVVLDELGVEGFGVYGAVTGLVTLGAFLPGSLAQATQRFFSFALGEENQERLNATFSVNLVLYILVALIAFVALQTVGIWFVENHLSIPADRFEAAKALYLYTAMAFVVSVVTTPFMAIIMAHEDMKLYAYISIIEAFMKLGVVFLLQYLTWDKLELYGLLLLCVAIVNAVLYAGVCIGRYKECQLKKIYWNSPLLNEIIGFTTWTVFGQVSTVARTHAVTLLLNQSFNPAVVAARALAIQIASQVNIFSANFNASLYPPIIKSYAANDRDSMHSLVVAGSKITFFLLWLFALPLIIEMEMLLSVWLTTVPPDAVFFSQLALIESLIFSISMPLAAAARAPGKMKAYELILGSVQIGIFIASWCAVVAGQPAYSVFIVAIVANILMFGVRLVLVSQLTALHISYFLKSAVQPVLLIVLVTSLPTVALNQLLPVGLLGSFLVILASFGLSTVAMYYIGLDRPWRDRMVATIRSRMRGWQNI